MTPLGAARAAAALDELPEEVRVHRIRRGLTQAEAAAEMGVGPWDLSRWENRRKDPSLKSVLAMLRWMAS